MAKILLIDENIYMCRMIKTSLIIEGHDVSIAMNGQKGLEQARKEKPEIIFIDIIHPVSYGFELCKLLKESDDTKNIPVVILKSGNEKENREMAKQAGASDCLTVPFKAKEISKIIKKLTKTSPYCKQKKKLKK